MPIGWINEHNPPRCCLACGFVPVEGMLRYLRLHGEKATCVTCGAVLPCTPPWQDNPVDMPEAIPQFMYSPVDEHTAPLGEL